MNFNSGRLHDMLIMQIAIVSLQVSERNLTDSMPKVYDEQKLAASASVEKQLLMGDFLMY
ncbi:hypothetical protein T01_5574 [Trichinella spiralis]|uniref:Uncharacterized protein n=1 Tax=Trichinella spiralis TaxID=6334 RepID=A0A0V1ARA5_TRISP|nr:hypothetical protein T01_5574 [Trichinella spiralis]